MAEERLRRSSFDLPGLAGGVLSFAVLLVIAYYFYLHSSEPDHGFVLDPYSGVVLSISDKCEQPGATCLRVGDRVLKIADVAYETYVERDDVAIFRPFKSLEGVSVELLRDGELVTEQIRALSAHRGLSTFVAFFFPALFWVMGTIGVVFLRPRDERWLLLVFFQYDTALWISSGMLAFSQEAYSARVFLVFICLFFPLSIHLHLILPDAPFKKYHRWILGPLYAIALVLMGLIQWQIVPRSTYYIATVAGMIGSLCLLVLRLFLFATPAEKVARRVMLYGVAMGLGPIAMLTLAYYLNPVALLGAEYVDFLLWIFLMVAPVWPLTYIYTIHKHNLGTFEFRANRLLGAYGFFGVLITVYIIGFTQLVVWWQSSGLNIAFFGLLFSLGFVAVGAPLYPWFQRLVDRHLFGILYRPNEIVSLFAERIPTAFNMGILRRIIVDELVPTLMIRQSALYVFGDSEIETVYQQDVSDSVREVGETELHGLIEISGRFLGDGAGLGENYRWVRLVLPLATPDETVGVWLLGRRDPDDFYSKSDIVILINLANQIGPVIENFRLVEKARQEVAENKRLQEQLIHSQKMEAIGRLSAGVAHDFNNILSVIIGYSNLVLAQYRNDEGLRQSINNIKDAGERAAGLTKQLLAFSRQQVMEPRVASVNAIVGDVEKMLRRLAGEDVHLVTLLGEELPRIKIDPGQMGQVIVNLVVNARDAMPDGGDISISTATVLCSSKTSSCHHGVPAGSYVLLQVEDTGTGIEQEIQHHMFDPYFTTKELGKGTGLGLSMVYGIISQSKGFIFVDTEKGKGTTFSIYLPAVSEDEASPAAEGQRLQVPYAGSETVLLVEDEKSVRAVTSEILQSNGYSVVEAEDGLVAVEKFEAYKDRIDLLLTDVVMPHMKGPELAKQLLKRAPGLKVIYMSGYNEEEVLGRRFDSSRSLLIHKPFSPHDLAVAVRRVLDERGPQESGF